MCVSGLFTAIDNVVFARLDSKSEELKKKTLSHLGVSYIEIIVYQYVM